MCPCRAVYEYYVNIYLQVFARVLGFLYVFGHLGLKGSHLSSERKHNTKKNVCKRAVGYIEHVCKISRFGNKTGVDIWTFGP